MARSDWLIGILMCGDNAALHALWGLIMRKQLGSQTFFNQWATILDPVGLGLPLKTFPPFRWVGGGGVVGTRAVAHAAPRHFMWWSSAQQSKPLASKSLSDVGTTWWWRGGIEKNCLFSSSLQQPPHPPPPPRAPDSSFHHGGGSHYLPAFTRPFYSHTVLCAA